jgi:transcriptional regulator with XRE-family HTH domain
MRARAESDFGRALRAWREERGKSQLRLAVDAGVSSRHLSFLESGRSQPSREMVLVLAGALEVPLRERNTLLAAAGYAAIYRETALDAPDLGFVKRVLGAALRATPYPAIVINQRYEILMSNDAATRLYERFAGRPIPPGVANALELMVPLTSCVENWDDVRAIILARARRELGASMVRAIEAALPAPARAPSPDDALAATPAMSIRLRKDDLAVSLFSIIATVGTPQDITLQELRIETFFPADPDSERTLARLTAG